MSLYFVQSCSPCSLMVAKASGSQLVPEIVHKASTIFHIFRSVQWYIPPVQIPYGHITRWILRNVFFARKILRFLIFLVAEFAFRGSSLTGHALRTRQRWQRNAEKYIKSLAPVEYHDILIPKYEIGCKVRNSDCKKRPWLLIRRF